DERPNWQPQFLFCQEDMNLVSHRPLKKQRKVVFKAAILVKSGFAAFLFYFFLLFFVCFRLFWWLLSHFILTKKSNSDHDRSGYSLEIQVTQGRKL
ncbi:MAG: hypothetical protein AAFR97_15665, partial [Bacteroidota bacterium]